MFDRNGPKYSTFRLIQGVGSAVFTVLFLSSMPSVLGPAELVLLPKVRLEAAMSLSLSLTLCYVGVPKSKHNPGSIPRPRTFLSGGFYADPDLARLGPNLPLFPPFLAFLTAATTPKRDKKLN